MTRGRDAVRLTIPSFVAPSPIADDATTVVLDEDAAHHIRVRRLDVGDVVTVRDGSGAVADGTIERLTRASAHVAVAGVRRVRQPPALRLLVPIADRERMLWLAEKSVELGVTHWQPVLWHRSRSVSPRGEGEAFAAKVRGRMAQALAQSEGAWLPTIESDIAPAAVEPPPPGTVALALDPEGASLAAVGDAPSALWLAIGPEGGLEGDELAALDALGFRRARLPGNILRFETAGVVGAAFARALLDAVPSNDPRDPSPADVAESVRR